MPDPKQLDDNTLPRPELNPLLNPVLASHMGRWAEVYFTNPPEKREEAVLELLRELGASPGAASETPPRPADQLQEAMRITEVDPPAAAVECASCAYRNPITQRFCGMCGAALAAPEAASSYRAQPGFAASDSGGFTGSPSAPGAATRQVTAETREAYTAPLAGFDTARPDPAWRTTRDDLPGLDFGSEPVGNRWRLYVGAVVAFLIAVLLIAQWRGTRGASPSNTATQGFPSSQASPSSQPAAAAPSSTQPTAAEAASSTQPAARGSATPQPVNQHPASTDASPKPASSTPATTDNGSEELALAQKYLNGNEGEARDSGQAATLLWKAVSKQNTAATLVLSDLYLRGDGVPRSCDQARLLLEAAARKGKAEAGERLRHLQAFGCQ